jgi:uncharacterized membrane protein YecN with MAPEG domain
MEISNKKRARNIKRFFILTGVLAVAAGQLLLWYKYELATIILAIVFAFFVVVFLSGGFCYIFFSTENNKVTIRYYPVIAIMGKAYQTIEFPQQSLLNFQIEKGLGFSDLTIAIRSQGRVAEYPPISLAALNKAEIEEIRLALVEIMKKNKSGI